ncbi:MAG: hypothetical protein ACHQ2Z_06815 [Elusimicrobiota bacterium]
MSVQKLGAMLFGAALGLAGCSPAPLSFYSHVEQAPAVKTVGIFVASDGFVRGRPYAGDDVWVPGQDTNGALNPRTPKNARNPVYGGGDTYGSFGWSAPEGTIKAGMTPETILRKTAELFPGDLPPHAGQKREGLFKNKIKPKVQEAPVMQASGGVNDAVRVGNSNEYRSNGYKKTKREKAPARQREPEFDPSLVTQPDYGQPIPQIPIGDGANRSLADALSSQFQSRGYQTKVLDFGSDDKLTINQVIEKAKAAGCDSVMVVQYHMVEAWISPIYTKVTVTQSGNVQTTTTEKKWLKFNGVKYQPRASLWSADGKLAWSGGRFDQHLIDWPEKKEAGKFESAGAGLSKMWGGMKNLAGRATGNADLQKSGAAQATAEMPAQRYEREFQESIAKLMSDHGLLTATAVDAKTNRMWDPIVVAAAKEAAKKALTAMADKMHAATDEAQKQYGADSMEAAGAKWAAGAAMQMGAAAVTGDSGSSAEGGGDAVSNVLQTAMDKIQKVSEGNFGRDEAVAKAAANTAREIISPTTEFVAKKEINGQKPFPWAGASKSQD